MAEIESKHILLVEDTKSIGEMYVHFLETQGYKATHVLSGRDALDLIEKDTPVHMILLDLKLPDMDGLDVMKALQDLNFTAPVIMITGHGSVNIAVKAMQMGASDFLIKPFDVEKMYKAVEKAMDGYGMIDRINAHNGMYDGIDGQEVAKTGVHSIVEPRSTKRDFGGFVGTSPAMQMIYEIIENAASSKAAIFITGESGTGKEVCAEAIHKYSSRANKPFIPINCAAIPKDLIESELFGHVKGAFTGAIAERIGAAKQADGGTLFLDEICEMDPGLQTKLLRFLQNFTFQKVGGSKLEETDIRIICATNRDPLEEIKAGRFREDLYYRLHVIPINMPPLRERGDDIIDIAQLLLLSFSREEEKRFKGFTDDAEDCLRRYSWPGNIRQLQNVIRSIVVLKDDEYVTEKMLPTEILFGSMQKQSGQKQVAQRQSEVQEKQSDNILYNRQLVRPLWMTEKEAIERAIAECGGNIPQAAEILEISPSTIYRKKLAWEKINKEQI